MTDGLTVHVHQGEEKVERNNEYRTHIHSITASAYGRTVMLTETESTNEDRGSSTDSTES